MAGGDGGAGADRREREYAGRADAGVAPVEAAVRPNLDDADGDAA